MLTGLRCTSAIFLASALSLSASTSALSGQTTPGQRIPQRERIHAEFINNIMDGINETRTEWADAVTEDDLDRLMETYAPGAMVVPPHGEPLYGWDAIRAYWLETLPGLGRVQAGLGDMDASGQMAMVGGTYSVERIRAQGAAAQETGGLLTVFVQSGRTWRIRAQVFATPSGG